MAIAQKMVQFCAKEPINKVNLSGLVVDAKKIIATNSEVLAFHNFNLVDLYEHQGTLPFVKRKIPQFLIPNYALELLPSSTVKPFTVTLIKKEDNLSMIISANGLKVVFPVEKTEFNFSKVLEKTSKISIIINTRDAENKIKTAISVSKYAKVSFDASKPSQIDFSCINPDSLVDFTFSLPVFSYHPKNLKTITGGLSLEDFLKIIKWENETYLKVYFNNLKFYFENSLLTCKTVQDVNSIFIEYTSIYRNPIEYPVVPSEAIEQKVESTTQKEAIEKDIVVSDLKEEPTSLIEEEIPVISSTVDNLSFLIICLISMEQSMLRIFDFLFGNLEPFLILLRYDGSMLADLLRLAFEISATSIITFNRSPNNLPASKFVLSDTSGNGFRLLYSHSKRFSFISS